MTRVTLMAGGVGGAKLAEGLAEIPEISLTVIGNVGDDEEFHGLWVSPDIDTMLYTLSGRVNRDQGWGVADESNRALEMLNCLGANTWMFLGDRDFGLHIYRTERLRSGDRPSDILADIASKFGINSKIVLPTDARVQTRVLTDGGWLSFQEYFVRERCQPEVLELSYNGLKSSKITLEAEQALMETELIVIAPSNPLVSILPILKIPGFHTVLQKATAPILAVSPLIAGKALKGPADRMLTSLNYRADAVGVAHFYENIAAHFLMDSNDVELSDEVSKLGMKPYTADILMPDLAGKVRVAHEILEIYKTISRLGSKC
ncbi:2-phospho-L-lactate transferase [Paracoccaceae bacterium]|nr:2-phospho-L-lactate transferase [Paracoccaceae bacterium]